MFFQKEEMEYAPHDYLEINTYLFMYFIFHNKDYTNIKLYKDVARDLKKPQGLYEEVPSTHNNGGYKTHYQYNKKIKDLF